jgi:hypothetical protein
MRLFGTTRRFHVETLHERDARNVRNIVLMRRINSMIEFKQTSYAPCGASRTPAKALLDSLAEKGYGREQLREIERMIATTRHWSSVVSQRYAKPLLAFSRTSLAGDPDPPQMRH